MIQLQYITRSNNHRKINQIWSTHTTVLFAILYTALTLRNLYLVK